VGGSRRRASPRPPGAADGARTAPVRRYAVAALERGLDILEALARGPLTLGAIAARTGLPKATAFRALATLEGRGFTDRGTGGTYRPGLRLIQLAQVAHADVDVRRVAQPYLQRLHELSGDTVNLAVWHDHRVLYLDVLPSLRPLRFVETPGSVAPLHATALGKAIAAHLPEPELASLLRAAGMPRFTPRTVTTVPRFEREVRAVRARGYALDRQEQDVGAICVAAPIFGGGGVVGAVSLAAPAARLDTRRLGGLVPALLDACAAISRTLGHDAAARPSPSPWPARRAAGCGRSAAARPRRRRG